LLFLPFPFTSTWRAGNWENDGISPANSRWSFVAAIFLTFLKKNVAV
jgi:hypothetical protein